MNELQLFQVNVLKWAIQSSLSHCPISFVYLRKTLQPYFYGIPSDIAENILLFAIEELIRLGYIQEITNSAEIINKAYKRV